MPHKGNYHRVLFVEPNKSGITLHNNVINDALNIDVPTFVNKMIDVAEEWLESAKHTTNFRNNYPKFMQRYDDGLPPYIAGVPVIA